MRLSIIIPVYNVEQWIGRCLESCLKQGLSDDDYELIVVNDGTQDRSMDVVEEYCQKVSNIVVVNQENKGLSVARNAGLSVAQGNYIWFVDSDDMLEEGYGAQLLTIAEKQDLDVLCFGLNLLYSDGRKEPYEIYCKGGQQVRLGRDFICSVGMPPAAWCALYRREFLLREGLNFYPDIYHEDMEFTPRAYALAQRISYVPYHVYNYAQREGSIMKSTSKATKKAKDLLIVCDSLYDFAGRRLKEHGDAYYCMLDKIAFSFSQSLRNYSKGSLSVSEYKNKPYYPLKYSKNLQRKEKLKYQLINFSIPLYLFVYKLIKI